jgi:hypothetical protein
MDGGPDIPEEIATGLFVLVERVFDLFTQIHETKSQVAVVTKHRIRLTVRMVFL